MHLPLLGLAASLMLGACAPDKAPAPGGDEATHVLDTHFDADPTIIPAHESDCTNGEDDDQDGDTDCYDRDCKGTDACVEICDDGRDNDGDYQIDCYDRDCQGTEVCLEICDDGIDNDADGDKDCWDSECEGTDDCVEICDDGIDNDADSHTDCYDEDCQGTDACVELCDDGLDNDGDYQVDCEDADCDGPPSCVEICDDGVDNDADGLVDCEDTTCSGPPSCVEICDDGVDNDADGLVDCEDGYCVGDASCVEVCDDGLDNDVDGLVDFWDDDCRDGVTAARLHVSGAGAASFRAVATGSTSSFGHTYRRYRSRGHRELEVHSVTGTAGFFNSAASTWNTCAWSVGRIQVTATWYRYTARPSGLHSTITRHSSSGGTPTRSSVTSTGACPYPMTAVLPPNIWHSRSHRSQWMARLATTSRGIEGWYIGSFGTTPTTSTSTTWTNTLGWSSVGWGHDRRYTGQILAGDTVSVSFP